MQVNNVVMLSSSLWSIRFHFKEIFVSSSLGPMHIILFTFYKGEKVEKRRRVGLRIYVVVSSCLVYILSFYKLPNFAYCICYEIFSLKRLASRLKQF